MKSVVAAEIAAITAWRVMSVGDRIGATLFSDAQCLHARPARTERKTVGWLGDLVQLNNALNVRTRQPSNASQLTDALEALERRIGHDHLVIVISDFFGCDDATFAAIKRIRTHNDVLCTQIFDPLEMYSTAFTPTPQMSERLAIPYIVDPVTESLVPTELLKTRVWPAGIVYGTVLDQANWLVANLNGGVFKLATSQLA